MDCNTIFDEGLTGRYANEAQVILETDTWWARVESGNVVVVSDSLYKDGSGAWQRRIETNVLTWR